MTPSLGPLFPVGGHRAEGWDLMRSPFDRLVRTLWAEPADPQPQGGTAELGGTPGGRRAPGLGRKGLQSRPLQVTQPLSEEMYGVWPGVWGAGFRGSL